MALLAATCAGEPPVALEATMSLPRWLKRRRRRPRRHCGGGSGGARLVRGMAAVWVALDQLRLAGGAVEDPWDWKFPKPGTRCFLQQDGSPTEYCRKIHGPQCTPMAKFIRQMTLIAGNMGRPGTRGEDVPGTLAHLKMPRAVVLDESTQRLYFADSANHAVRMFVVATERLTTVAGQLGKAGASGDDGPAVRALLREPYGLAMDETAQVLYVADQGNHAVRRLDVASGLLTTIAGVLGVASDPFPPGGADAVLPQLATSARLLLPAGVSFDAARNMLYIADQGNHAVRALDLSGGNLSTLEGSPAEMLAPTGLVLEPRYNKLYITDRDSGVIWEIDLEHGNSSALTGVPQKSGPYELHWDVKIDGLLIPTAEVKGTCAGGICTDDHECLKSRCDITPDCHGFSLEPNKCARFFKRGNLVPDPYYTRSYVREAELYGTRWFFNSSGLAQRDFNYAVQLPLRRASGMALDHGARRLYVADETASAVWMVDLVAGTFKRAVAMSGYYGHHTGTPIVGPVGLYVTERTVTAFRVAHIQYTFDSISTFGRWFYFDGSKLPYKAGVFMVVQYRRGVPIWQGNVEFIDGILFIGPNNRQSDCPECTAQGLRWPDFYEARSNQWEVGDLVRVVDLHPPDRQLLFTAEAQNSVVRVTEISNPGLDDFCANTTSQPHASLKDYY
eukprot:TRINITY_DN26650_c0_g2_i1.p1 TRINITY_DN26650_c0_g2~~TRINITY_DN26650_c0_g2_i1.p1  ORF type:complete len:675 (+),score=115.57 TRINITY_DN26650_c0_g2_i1:56-2080(+)